ncbi:Amino acid transporter, partial [Trichostrongylus colubriformis]
MTFEGVGRLSWIRRNLFLVCTLSSVVVGTVGGSLLRLLSLNDDVIVMIGLPGELFMNMLRAMILPLIVASLVSGVSMLDGRSAGKLATRSFIYYTAATLHA